MEHQNQQPDAIVAGAMVEATDGFVGTVVAVAHDPETAQLMNIVVQNENESKQFTLSGDLIARVIGSRVVHLKIGRADLATMAQDTQIDTNTGNFGHPTPPSPQ